MSASNFNWVCFPCRLAKRHATYAKTVPTCPGCGGDLRCLFGKVEVPRKIDLRAWRRLHLDYRQRSLKWSDQRAVQRVRAAHAAEREVSCLRASDPVGCRQDIPGRLVEESRLDRLVWHWTW